MQNPKNTAQDNEFPVERLMMETFELLQDMGNQGFDIVMTWCTLEDKQKKPTARRGLNIRVTHLKMKAVVHVIVRYEPEDTAQLREMYSHLLEIQAGEFFPNALNA